MTTEKTKAALVALRDHVNKHVTQWDDAANGSHHHPIWVMVAESLTAQAEAQPADDDVREAVEFADKERKAWKEKADNETHAMLREHAYRPIEKHYETLIRAATAPKYTEEQWLKLFKTVFARTWTPEQAVEHMKDDVSECVATVPKQTDAQRQEEKTCTCGAAGSGEGHTDWCDWLDVECPAAVPQEVVKRAVEEAISEATTCWNPRPSGVFQYGRAIGIANRLIALLGGKEG